MLEQLSTLAMPLVTALVGALLLFGKPTYFQSFARGATEGLRTAVGLLPTLIALTIAVSMLHASGAIDYLASIIGPFAQRIGLPTELIPFLLTRPISGSASTATYRDLLGRVGADSLAGLCASVIFGSSDTLFYVITVYSSAAGFRRTRGAVPCGLAVMFFCIFFSCFLCRLWFC